MVSDLFERPTRGTVCGTMRSMCGADAGCLAINYQSLRWGTNGRWRLEGGRLVGVEAEAFLKSTCKILKVNFKDFKRVHRHKTGAGYGSRLVGVEAGGG